MNSRFFEYEMDGNGRGSVRCRYQQGAATRISERLLQLVGIEESHVTVNRELVRGMSAFIVFFVKYFYFFLLCPWSIFVLHVFIFIVILLFTRLSMIYFTCLSLVNLSIVLCVIFVHLFHFFQLFLLGAALCVTRDLNSKSKYAHVN